MRTFHLGGESSPHWLILHTPLAPFYRREVFFTSQAFNLDTGYLDCTGTPIRIGDVVSYSEIRHSLSDSDSYGERVIGTRFIVRASNSDSPFQLERITYHTIDRLNDGSDIVNFDIEAFEVCDITSERIDQLRIIFNIFDTPSRIYSIFKRYVSHVFAIIDLKRGKAVVG